MCDFRKLFLRVTIKFRSELLIIGNLINYIGPLYWILNQELITRLILVVAFLNNHVFHMNL